VSALDPDLVRVSLDGDSDARAALEQTMLGAIEQDVDRSPGCVVLGGLAGLAEDELRRAMLLLSRLVGDLIPQDAAGAVLREVRDRGVQLGEGKTGRYSDSRAGGNFHTDGPHRPGAPPDYVALGCVRQAPEGGESVVVHAEGVVSRLAGEPRILETLAGWFHFDRREEPARPPTVARRILVQEEGRPVACYLREYIELGHRHAEVPPLDGAQREALDALDAELENPALQITRKLAPGELAIIDNRSVFHGRRSFDDSADEGEKRLLLRTWIRRSERESARAG
jgi:alpha-ketoglutarate-dependent taurine dioxygenase